MDFFSDKCKECKSKSNVQLCPYCRKNVCTKCLSYLITRKGNPEWFIGKKVRDYNDYKKLYDEYCNAIKRKGLNIHCCETYILDTWTAITKEAIRKSEEAHVKVSSIILR